MSDSPGTPSVRQWPTIVALCVFCLTLNGIILGDFHPRMAGRGDDNCAYYAWRAFAQVQLPGDVHHNKMQSEYIWLSAPHWLSYLAIRFLGVEPVQCGLVFTAIKPWLIVFCLYFFVFSLTRRPLASAFTAVLVLSASIIPINLGDFGILLDEPYQSDFTYPLVILVLAFLLNHRLGWALAAMLGLALVHPSMTLVCGGLVLAVLASCRREYTLKQWAGAAVMALPILACVVGPATLAFRTVAAEDLGSARDIYDALNQTRHGQMWERDTWFVWLWASAKILALLLPVFLSPTFEWNRKTKIVIAAIAGAIAMTLAGLLAKQMCIWLYDSAWLSVAIRFHQIFLPRGSCFALILALSLTVPHLLSIVTSGSSSLISRGAGAFVLLLLLDGFHPLGIRADDRSAALLLGALILCLMLSEGSAAIGRLPRFGRLPMVMSVAAFALLAGSFALFAHDYPFRTTSPRLLSIRMIPGLWCLGAVVLSVLPTAWVIRLGGGTTSASDAERVSEPSAGPTWALPAPAWWLVLAMAAGVAFSAWYTLARMELGFLSSLRILGVAAAPPLVWFACRRPWVVSSVFLLAACAIQVHSATNMLLPAHHPSRSWYSASQWARQNTAKESSFLFVTEYRERPWTWCAWRTYSQRGFVPLFEPAWPLSYVPDLGYLKAVEPMQAHFAARYPGRERKEYFDLMDAADLVWLRDTIGARYALSYSSHSLPGRCVFRNDHFAIYDLMDLSAGVH